MFSKKDEKATVEVTSLKGDNMSTYSKESEMPPSYSEATAAQSFDITYKDWKTTRALVRDSNSNQLQYNIELPTLARAHINLKAANSDKDDTKIATANPYTLTKRITASVRGQDLHMKFAKILKCDYSYTSPAFNNATMSWKCYSGITHMTYILMDEQSLPVARWKLSGPKLGPFKTLGTLEILGENRVVSDLAKEEMLITGMAMVFFEIYARSQGTLGASAIGTMIAVGAGSGSKKGPDGK